jgi:hypothetical protein
LDDCHGSVAWVSFAPVTAAVTLDYGEVGIWGVVDSEVEIGWGCCAGESEEGDFGCVGGQWGCSVLGCKGGLGKLTAFERRWCTD